VTAHLADHVGPFPGDLLFPSGGSGEYIDIGWRNAWNRARRIVGVGGEVREHDLRHFYGTALAEAGVSAVQLRSAMGHASIQTSMIYVNAKRGASADVANLLKPPPAAAASKVVPLPTSGR
jgi:integrase